MMLVNRMMYRHSNILFLSHYPVPASVTPPGVDQIERFTFKKKVIRLKVIIEVNLTIMFRF